MADDSIPFDMPLSDSVEGIVLQCVERRLKSLNLPGITPERVLVQSLAWMPNPDDVPPPYVIISPAPESTPWDDGTNERDEVVFGVIVSLVLANQRNMVRGMGLQLYWRERIRRAFQNKTIAALADYLAFTDSSALIRTSVESGDKFIEAAKRDQRDAQYYVIRFRVREGRE